MNHIQRNKTIFFNTITSHIAIIYQNWVAYMKSKLYLNT